VTIGGSIALIVVGAILRSALNFSPAYVHLQLVGVILMIAGAIGLIISLTFLARRRRAVVGRSVVGPGAEVYEERRYTSLYLVPRGDRHCLHLAGPGAGRGGTRGRRHRPGGGARWPAADRGTRVPPRG
jgi:Domain of unknown function (DUF6458)